MAYGFWRKISPCAVAGGGDPGWTAINARGYNLIPSSLGMSS